MANFNDGCLEQAASFMQRGWYIDALAILRGGVDQLFDDREYDKYFEYARQVGRCLYLMGNYEDALLAYYTVFQFIRTNRKNNINEIELIVNSMCYDFAPEIGYTLAAAADSRLYSASFADAIKSGDEDYNKEKFLNVGFEWAQQIIKNEPDERMLEIAFKNIMHIDVSFR